MGHCSCLNLYSENCSVSGCMHQSSKLHDLVRFSLDFLTQTKNRQQQRMVLKRGRILKVRTTFLSESKPSHLFIFFFLLFSLFLEYSLAQVTRIKNKIRSTLTILSLTQYILHSILCIFPIVLNKRIASKINGLFS